MGAQSPIFSALAVVGSIIIVRFSFLEMKPALAKTFFGAAWPAPAFPFWSGFAAFARSGRTVARQ